MRQRMAKRKMPMEANEEIHAFTSADDKQDQKQLFHGQKDYHIGKPASAPAALPFRAYVT